MKLPLKRIPFGLRAKLTLLIEGVVVLVVSLTGVLVALHEKETLEKELCKRGLSLATGLSGLVAGHVINNDLAGLRRYIKNATEQEYVLYVAILDADGKVIMHNDLSEIGKSYKGIIGDRTVSDESCYDTVDRMESGETYSLIFSPISVSTLKLGTVLLGYSHIAVEKQVARSSLRVLMIGLITSLAGGVVAFLLAAFISSPIRRITEATKEVARGNLHVGLSAERNDEIGALAGAFNKMTEDLRRTTVSKNYVDNILGSMNDNLLVTDDNGVIISMNRATCALLGYEEEELAGKDICLIMADDGKISDHSDFVRDLGERSAINEELTYRTKGGTLIPVLLSAAILRDNDGARKGIVWIARDITERKAAEEALQASERKYRTLFEASQDVVYFSTPEGKFIDINPAGVELFGYGTKEELLRTGIPSPDEIAGSLEAIQQLISMQGFVKDYEMEFRRKDGEKVVVLLTETSVHDPEGEIIGYQGIMKDITERKRLELQLLQSQKMEAIGTLAGGIAHDFNNILTVIIGCGTLLQEMNRDADLDPDITMIVDSARKAAGMTRSLLTFSRKQAMRSRYVDLNEIIREFGRMLSRIIEEDIQLSIVLSERRLPLKADPGQMEQVMMNLAMNARDAMPDGGVLSITTNSAEMDDRFTKAHGYGRPGTYAVVTVEDNGKGMDAVTRERLFEPFYTTKETGRGTGLGLSIVYGIIRQHDGHIDVGVGRSGGTVFTIYLPLAGHGEKETEPAFPVIRGGSERILVVEDNREVRRLISQVLTGHGYPVIDAVDSDDAIEIFRQDKDRIQLVILDVIMPKKNGKQVYDEIKDMKPDVKTLFVSGYDANILHNRGIIKDRIEFIAKPFLPGELLHRVREILDR